MASQEQVVDEQQVEDQWAVSGAPNFESALGIAATLYSGMVDEYQDDIILMIVDRAGGVFVMGLGEKFPTNEDAPVPSGFIVTKDDIINALESSDEEPNDEEPDDEEEEEEEAEEGDSDTPPDDIEID